MNIADFLTPHRVILDLRTRDKPSLIAEIARFYARAAPSLQPDVVQAALWAREQLGSTGLGGGFALPHARVAGLAGFLGLFVRLAKPLAFDAIDGKPVRLVFALLIPSENDPPHVAALAAISRRFRDSAAVERLKVAEDADSVFHILTDS